MPKIYMPGTSGLGPQYGGKDWPYGCRFGTIWRLKPLPVTEMGGAEADGKGILELLGIGECFIFGDSNVFFY